jgi:hypothetical protein
MLFFPQAARDANVFISLKHSQSIPSKIGPGPSYNVTRDASTGKV